MDILNNGRGAVEAPDGKNNAVLMGQIQELEDRVQKYDQLLRGYRKRQLVKQETIMNQTKDMLQRLLIFDASLIKAIKKQPTPFNVDRVRAILFSP